jgi:hypothetical protein
MKKRCMEIIGHSILALSIIGILWQFFRTRRRARNGEIIVPPFFAGLLIFSLCLIGVIVLGVSRLHLLWLLPLSYVLGTILLLVPVIQKIIMKFLMITMPRSFEDELRGPVVSQEKRKRAKKPPGSKRRKR